MDDLKKKKQRPHWYRTTSYVCPICFRTEEVRERVYGEKPRASERFEIIDHVCSGHLLYGF